MKNHQYVVQCCTFVLLLIAVINVSIAAVPPAPVITAKAGNESVTLSWESVYAAHAYNVYVSNSPKINIKNYFTKKIPGVTGSSFDVTQLSNGIQYYFIVQSVNNKGSSYGSNVVSATPGTQSIVGFDGPFAPSEWAIGSNSPTNLVNTSNAPASVILSNYAPWAVSGAIFKMTSSPLAGKVKFSYSTTNITAVCPATYSVNGVVTKLTESSGSIEFAVAAGDSFGFALNGNDMPGDFGCKSRGVSTKTFTLSNFEFIQ